MRLLLHSCCGPCTTFPLHFYRSQGVIVEGVFFNPNIYPAKEEQKRWLTLKTWAHSSNYKVRRISIAYDDWLQTISDDYTKPERCKNCYRVRFEKIAQIAQNEKYDGFSTTLLVSPYQNHQGIVDIMEEVSRKYRVPYVYNDFRRGYLRSRQIARGCHMYMQNYCGCQFSIGGEK